MTLRDYKSVSEGGSTERWLRFRVRLLGAVFFACLGGLFFRAVQLQVHERDRLRGLAEDQYLRESEIPGRRGDIFDRRGVPLAQSVEVDSVWVDPTLLADQAAAVRALSKALTVDAKELQERLSKARRFAWLKRQVTPSEVARVKALDLPGVGLVKEPRRFYPQRELAAHLIGLVGTDAHGLDGLELAFDAELTGDRVRRSAVRDARGRRLLTHEVEDAASQAGATITLTIDRQLQYIAEKALVRAVESSAATAGMAVILDPQTGELLALANAPRFNPNTPGRSPQDALRNRSVTDAFEPGSTMKAFTVATALDEGAVTAETTVDCEDGAWVVGRHVVHDTHPHRLLKPREVLQVSSNIGAAKIGQRLGGPRLREGLARFGFGERSELGLPSEPKGSVPSPRSDISVVTQSYGQGLTTTAVQLVSAYGALANGGVLMRPYVVAKVVDSDGLPLLENRPTAQRRAVSAAAASTVLEMLESVVEKGGTAPLARLDDYRVAGKTGTAQKADPVVRGYSDKRIASFVGVVPSRSPRLVIAVILDEPTTDVYGGVVAAPAFKEIATAALASLGVPPAPGPRPGPTARVERRQDADREGPPVPAKDGRAALLDALTELALAPGAGERPGAVRVPDVGGKSGRRAVSQVLAAALEPRLAGSGRVVSQHPVAGSLVERGSAVTLELAENLPSIPR